MDRTRRKGQLVEQRLEGSSDPLSDDPMHLLRVVQCTTDSCSNYEYTYVCISLGPLDPTEQKQGESSPYLLPSLLTTLLGTSNRQLGQYQFKISSVQQRGQRI